VYQAAFRNLDRPSEGGSASGFWRQGCGIPFGDDAFIPATLDEDAVAICDVIHSLIAGISEVSSHAAFSMAYYSGMRRGDFLAGAISLRLVKYFCTRLTRNSRGCSRLHSEQISSPPLQMPLLTPPSPRTVHSCQLG
jgi:hypothetical protein